MTGVRYPFVPKSTAYLAPGQFWSIPLSIGRFACGRVLQLDNTGGSRRTFIAGLLDWCDESPPTSEAIAGARLLAHGEVHVKTVVENGGEILGLRPLEIDELDVPLTLDESPGPPCRLRQGFDVLGTATLKQQRELKVFSTWGYSFIKILAEKRYVSGNDDHSRTDARRTPNKPMQSDRPSAGR